MKLSRAVKEATTVISLGVLSLSFLMQAIYLLVVALSPALTWHYSFLLGNLLMGATVVFNFFLMAVGINSSVGADPEFARKKAQFSHTLRSLLVIGVLVLAFLLPQVFHRVATVVPVTFVQISVLVYNLLLHRKGGSTSQEEVTDTSE